MPDEATAPPTSAPAPTTTPAPSTTTPSAAADLVNADPDEIVIGPSSTMNAKVHEQLERFDLDVDPRQAEAICRVFVGEDDELIQG